MKSAGASSGTWWASAQTRRSSKLRHLWLVLKSVKAWGVVRSHQTWPRTPVSVVHISCWRTMSRQWAEWLLVGEGRAWMGAGEYKVGGGEVGGEKMERTGK